MCFFILTEVEDALAGRVRIGISGWNYKAWRGDFYPKGLLQKKELAYAASLFGSIEINGTFYSLQRPSSFQRWAEETPEDFVFSVKGSRFITHMLKLRGVEQALANFFSSGLLTLGAKLGPILWQFPERFAFDPERIEQFFHLLPRDTEQMSELARRHDKRTDGRAYTEFDKKRPVRHAMEIRHMSFVVPEFVALLRRYNVALVCADAVDWPCLMDVTADFIYCRLHGSEELYTSQYTAKDLDEWAARVVEWARGREVLDGERGSDQAARRRSGRDVFVYFDNDAKVFAPKDALGLEERVKRLASS